VVVDPSCSAQKTKPDGRQPHFKSQCDSIAVFLLLLPDTRYRNLHGSQIDKAIAALGGMPSGLSLPLAFGMYTLLMGAGR
jgi:hypothetical protein